MAKAMLFIVTVKGERNPNHNPMRKVSARCMVSDWCTDQTGHHHSVLVDDESPETAARAARAACLRAGTPVSVTRVEHVTTTIRIGG